MKREQQKAKMTLAYEFSRKAERSKSHRFGPQEDKHYPSPKLSPAGQYYLKCRDCERSVFDDGSGSAMQTQCSK